MFDLLLRPLKDTLFTPLTPLLPSSLTPHHLTLLSLLSGLLSCALLALSSHSRSRTPTLLLWALNRILDCLDGALARHRGQASDLGGFLDLLSDFIVYSLIPIACGIAACRTIGEGEVEGERGVGATVQSVWLPIALLEASFHINNFVLFYVAAVVEKRKAGKAAARDGKKVRELTSVAMRPALVEGFESGLIFTAMLAWPEYVRELAWGMAGLVAVGTVQRVWWVSKVLDGHASS